MQSGDSVQIVKRSDGNLSFHVAVTTDVEALRQHRVTLHGNTYAFRSRAAIDRRFFLDVINFTVLDDVEALTQQLLIAGFKVMSCTPKICGRREKTSTPMLRVYTVDFATPECAMVNGQPMDQILLDGKTYTVNCRGSRSGASPRSRSPHCLVLSAPRPVECDQTDVATGTPDRGSADFDVDMSGPTRTAMDLARICAEPAAFATLSQVNKWTQVRTTRRLSESMRDLPATKIVWTTENRFAALADMDPVTSAATWSSSPSEPPNAQYYQTALDTRPPAAERLQPCSAFTARKSDSQHGCSTMKVELMTVQEVEWAINAVAPLDTPQLQEIVDTEFLHVADIDAKLRTCPDYGEIGASLRAHPVATVVTLLSYVRERDTALEGIVDMHLFARSLAARDVTSGRSYVQEVWALLQTEPELTRAPVTAWAHHITATAAGHTAILCINRALALFELLLRAMAPCVEQNDQLLMLLSGVQVHWLPMLHDRFLHPATLLAIAATDIGRDIIRVGLLNDNTNPLLCLLRDGIDDESLLQSWLANDLALEAAIDSGRLTATVVSGLAQY